MDIVYIYVFYNKLSKIVLEKKYFFLYNLSIVEKYKITFRSVLLVVSIINEGEYI